MCFMVHMERAMALTLSIHDKLLLAAIALSVAYCAAVLLTVLR